LAPRSAPRMGRALCSGPFPESLLVPTGLFYNAGRHNFRKGHNLMLNRRFSPAVLARGETLIANSSLLQAKEKETEHENAKSDTAADDKDNNPRHLADESQVTQGAITVAGRKVVYQAEAGVLVIHEK